MAAKQCVLVAALGLGAVEGTGMSMRMTRANPIRKVVTMLQNIQKKVEAEGKEAEDLYEKFECECNKIQAGLSKQIEAAETKGADVAAAGEAGASQAKQIAAEIKQAKTDRASAKEAIAAATGIREKEAATFKASSTEAKANIQAMGSAIAAIAKGGSSFLQTGAAQKLQQLLQSSDTVTEDDREEVRAFLAGEEGAEGSGEIVGMLKQQQETMSKDLSEDEATEADAIKTYKELVAAKNSEFNTLQAAIEEKMARAGELGVANAEAANDGGDTGDALEKDKKLLADSKASCAARAKEWEAEKNTRGEEVLALADTIKMLNSDEALELFKKAIPSASFLQIPVTTSAVKAHALAALQKAQKHHNPKLDFIALALRGKKVGLDSVVSMIDKMIGALNMDQKEDDDKVAYCKLEFDKADDEKKAFERKVSDAETAIKDAKESVATLIKEIEATKAAIVELDGEVAIAGAQRQKENAAYKTLVTQNAAAEELITMAKTRLNKFYGGAFLQSKTSMDVVAMMSTLIADLQKETAVADTEEKNAQADYETAMADAKETRISQTKSLEDKESAKSDADEAVQTNVDAKTAAGKELQGVLDYIMTLRADCDWIIKYYDTRKSARGDELDALGKAKDVLNGADFSFVQVAQSESRALRGVSRHF